MTTRKKPDWTFWITAGVVVLLVVYPLSAGPAEWLYERDMIPDFLQQTAIVFYSPLDWLRLQNESFGIAIEWYMDLWINR